jgi:capsule polysaccharide export protein KpsE/RkpR
MENSKEDMKITPDSGRAQLQRPEPASWIRNATLFWEHRRLFLRVGVVALVVSIAIALSIPKQYESIARIMPPEQQGGGAAILAALVGRAAPGGLGTLASSLLGVKGSGSLSMDLLQSKTIGEHLVDRFGLQKLYKNHYRQDTLRQLAHRTVVKDDKKSGVITIAVTDRDQRRARDMAQAYLDELNTFMAKVNTSSAHRERLFVEQRLTSVKQELDQAQQELSEFSSANATIDVKEQTRAMVDAGARLQAQLIVGQSELNSLQQIYGEENVRVRAGRARVAVLQHELEKMSGSNEPTGEDAKQDATAMYPSLKQLPRLSVRWADLYRRVRIHETVFELLSQEYEMTRIEEVKELPTVSVIDPPSWPEKKSSPPRRWIVLGMTAAALFATAIMLLIRRGWRDLLPEDPRKILGSRIWLTVKTRYSALLAGRLSGDNAGESL